MPIKKTGFIYLFIATTPPLPSKYLPIYLLVIICLYWNRTTSYFDLNLFFGQLDLGLKKQDLWPILNQYTQRKPLYFANSTGGSLLKLPKSDFQSEFQELSECS